MFLSNFSIAKRLLLALLLLSVVPITTVSYSFLRTFQTDLIAEATRLVSTLADDKYKQFSNFLIEKINNIKILASIPTTGDDLRAFASQIQDHQGARYQELDAKRRDFYTKLTKYSDYYDLFLIEPNGTIVFSVAHETDFATNLYTGPYHTSELALVVRQAATTLETGFSKMANYQPSNAPAIFLASPVVRAGQLIGVIAVQIDTKRFNAVINDDTGLGASGETVVAQSDQDGALFLTPLRHDPNAALQRRVDFTSPWAKPIQLAVQGQNGQGIHLDYRGEPVVAAWRYIPHLRFGMVVKVDTAEALATVNLMWRNGVLAIALTLLLVMLIGRVLYRSIVTPLQQLTSATREIAEGRLEQRAPVQGQDEIAHLATAFNTMVDAVHCAQTSLEHRVEERTKDLSLANERLLLAGIVFECTSEAVVVTDAQSCILEINDAFCRITGFSREEMVGQNPNKHKSGRHDAAFYQQMWQSLNDTGHWAGEIWDRRKNGEVYPKWLSINAVRNSGGEVTYYVGIFSDISTQKQIASDLERLAFYDPLTTLPNRALFQDRLHNAIAAAQRNGSKMALLFIDLDRFKWVNDTLGHAAGDELLVEVAARLRQGIRATDTVARLGGDEFTIIMPDITHPERVSSMGQTIIELVRKPFKVKGRDVHVGVSIGVAIYPEDGLDVDTLSKHADMAMYTAKEAGRNNCKFFSAKLHALAFDRISMEGDLHKGLEHQEFALFYQPKVDTLTRRVVGMESLVRWFKPEGGMVSPAQFIPLAEETGLIIPLGQWILQTACAQNAAWNQTLAAPLKVAVNLSMRQFNHDRVVAMVQEALLQSGVNPEQVELEITESMVMGNIENTITKMKQLRDLGLSLAIDDFGTGFSSLSYLKRFPINTLKIDQSFVRELTENSDDAAIVDAVIALAKSMHLTVVAEGVENSTQLDYLGKRGCDQIQGYFFSRPLPTSDFLPFLAKHDAKHSLE